MEQVLIYPDMIAQAKENAEGIERAARASGRESLHNSITGGDGTLAGCIGEIAVAKSLGVTPCGTYNFDVVGPNGSRWEVKTKRTTVKPDFDFEASLCAHNIKQECDYYAFVRVTYNNSVAWIMGYCSRQYYLDQAEYIKKFTKDRTNNFTFKENCWNLPYYFLEPWNPDYREEALLLSEEEKRERWAADLRKLIKPKVGKERWGKKPTPCRTPA